MLTTFVLLALQPPPDTAPPPPAGHPTITEVLYAVPSRGDSDANKDGKRSAVGDEFVEIANLTGKPIQLKGYALVDSDAYEDEHPSAPRPAPGAKDGKPSRPPAAPGESVRFQFPELELKPGEVVVVFNGYESSIPGPVGDAAKAAGHNDRFAGAYVFSMKVTSEYAAFGNGGDWVMLTAPDGKPVEAVKWGQARFAVPAGCRTQEAPPGNASVQLDRATGKFVPHRSITATGTAQPFSPGEFGAASPSEAPRAAPAKP